MVSRTRHLAFMQYFEATLDKADGDSTFVRKINDAASPTSLASLLRSLNNLLRADRLEDVLRPLESLPLSISLYFLVPYHYDSTPDGEQIPFGRRYKVDCSCGLQTERGGREQMTGKHLNRHRKAETPRAPSRLCTSMSPRPPRSKGLPTHDLRE